MPDGGGTNDGYGNVFKVSASGSFISLFSFDYSDGAYPEAGLVFGNDGNLYGTTFGGGTNHSLYDRVGTVFKFNGNGALTGLHTFTGDRDGANPMASLIYANNGNFYGTTSIGGDSNLGSVFEINTNKTLRTLYSFSGVNDGANPFAGLVLGSDGNFYGTTSSGGTSNLGVIFKINTNGTLINLHSFTGGNGGAQPYAALLEGSDGDFYGTTFDGGASNAGVVFKFTTNGGLTNLYSFTGGKGAGPSAALVQGSDGDFYGTTEFGGIDFGYGSFGTVFKISPGGKLATLYSFGAVLDTNYDLLDGANPCAGLVMGAGGDFYGTTYYGGGANNLGTVFRLTILPPPQLTILASGGNITLAWPTNAVLLTLQFATNLAPPTIWNTNSILPIIVNGQNVVTSFMTGSQMFYRLK